MRGLPSGAKPVCKSVWQHDCGYVPSEISLPIMLAISIAEKSIGLRICIHVRDVGLNAKLRESLCHISRQVEVNFIASNEHGFRIWVEF